MTKSKSREPKLPPAYQDVLSNLYAGRLHTRNRRADEMNDRAHDLIFQHGYWSKTQTGLRVYRTKQIDEVVDGKETRFSLMTERKLRTDALVCTLKQVVTLAINGDFYLPAALFIPPDESGHSASVVVSEHVNDEEHMDGIDVILGKMATAYDKAEARRDSDPEYRGYWTR